MLTVTLIATLLAAAPENGASPAAEPLSNAQIQQRIDTFLGAIDTPVAPDQWRVLGDRGAVILEGIARNEKQLPTRRAQAVNGLTAIGSTRAIDALGELARDEHAPFVVRRHAVQGLGERVAPAKLLRLLRPVMTKAGDSRVRLTAAEVLARKAPVQSCGAIRSHAATEGGESRAMFDAPLGDCAKASAKSE